VKSRDRIGWFWRRNVADVVSDNLNEKVYKAAENDGRRYVVEQSKLWGRIPFGWDVVRYIDA